MYCLNCGKQLPEGSVFCGACGSRVDSARRNAPLGQTGNGDYRGWSSRPSGGEAPSGLRGVAEQSTAERTERTGWSKAGWILALVAASLHLVLNAYSLLENRELFDFIASSGLLIYPVLTLAAFLAALVLDLLTRPAQGWLTALPLAAFAVIQIVWFMDLNRNDLDAAWVWQSIALYGAGSLIFLTVYLINALLRPKHYVLAILLCIGAFLNAFVAMVFCGGMVHGLLHMLQIAYLAPFFAAYAVLACNSVRPVRKRFTPAAQPGTAWYAAPVQSGNGNQPFAAAPSRANGFAPVLTPSGFAGPGDRYLGFLALNRYIVDEKVSAFHFANAYKVFDEAANLVGTVEQVNISGGAKAARLLLGSGVKGMQKFHYLLKDSSGAPIAGVRRDGIGSGLAAMRTIALDDGSGNQIGQMQSVPHFGSSELLVSDAEGSQICRIIGDWKGWNFRIVDAAGAEIGTVNKRWNGIRKELFTSADKYCVSVGPQVTGLQRLMTAAAAITVDMVLHEF